MSVPKDYIYKVNSCAPRLKLTYVKHGLMFLSFHYKKTMMQSRVDLLARNTTYCIELYIVLSIIFYIFILSSM